MRCSVGSQHPYGYYVEQLIYNGKSTVSRTTLNTEPSFQPFTDLTEHLHPQHQIPAHRHHRKPPRVQFPHPWWVTAVPVVGGELHNISWVSCCRWSVWFLVAVTDSAPFHRKHSKVQRITFVPRQMKLAASVWTMTELQLSVWAIKHWHCNQLCHHLLLTAQPGELGPAVRQHRKPPQVHHLCDRWWQ